MRTMTRVLLVAALTVVCGPSSTGHATLATAARRPATQSAGTPSSSTQAKADIRDAKGQMVGQATLTQTTNGVQIRLTLIGVPQGVHAFHIHEIGKCDPPGFMTAGAHLNPEHKQHGRDNPMGRHAGDLPNITIPSSGRLIVENVEPMVTMNAGAANSLFDVNGAALVIHQAADDNKTDPDGNAGMRIACGVITR